MNTKSGRARGGLWRAVVYSLVVIIVGLGVSLSEKWTSPEVTASNRGEIESGKSLMTPRPLLEQERLRSPDGKVDAVILESKGAFEDSDGNDTGFFALYLTPAGKGVPEPPPYGHISVHLKRMVSGAIFVGVQLEDFDVTWDGDRTLSVRGSHAVVYAKKERSPEVLENDEEIEIAYFFDDWRYSDAFNIKWAELGSEP